MAGTVGRARAALHSPDFRALLAGRLLNQLGDGFFQAFLVAQLKSPSRTVLPGNMLAFGSPDSRTLTPCKSMAGARHGLGPLSSATATAASSRICSTPRRHRRARTVETHALTGLPSGIVPSNSDASTAAAQRSASSGRPRSACSHTPKTAMAG